MTRHGRTISASSLRVVTQRNSSPRVRNHQSTSLVCESNRIWAVPVFFHKRKCKLAAGRTQGAQGSNQGQHDVCREIHQQTFGDPECAFSRIEPSVDQRFSIDTGCTQINCEIMHSFNSDFGTGAHFVTLRSWMIDLPKFARWKIPLQFVTKRGEACADYDDLGKAVSQC